MQILFQNEKRRKKVKTIRVFNPHCLFAISLIMRGSPPSRKKEKDMEAKTRKGDRRERKRTEKKRIVIEVGQWRRKTKWRKREKLVKGKRVEKTRRENGNTKERITKIRQKLFQCGKKRRKKERDKRKKERVPCLQTCFLVCYLCHHVLRSFQKEKQKRSEKNKFRQMKGEKNSQQRFISEVRKGRGKRQEEVRETGKASKGKRAEETRREE